MRAAANRPNINIVAVNDPFIPVEYMEYMYKYDSTHGRANQDVSHDPSNNTVIIDGKPIKVFDQMDPSKIDWVRFVEWLTDDDMECLSYTKYQILYCNKYI